MAVTLTDNMIAASQNQSLTPILVLDISGSPYLYTSGNLQEGAINALTDVANQKQIISLSKSGGSSSEIKQSLNIDKGTDESITSMRITLIDYNLQATQLISPGVVVADILGRSCNVWLGFAGTLWRDDYVIIFRGIIDDVDAKSGTVTLNIAGPDQKKRGSILPKAQTKLTAILSNVATTATVTDTTQFLTPYTGPSGSIDTSLKLYLRVDDEIMRYESTTGTTFATLTRGALGTTAAQHEIDAEVSSFYTLSGNAIDLALKLMLSGVSGNYSTGVAIENFVQIDPAPVTVANSIFFSDINLEMQYNPIVGDFISTSGASNGANNVSLKPITQITKTNLGWYIVVSGVTFVSEVGTAATISFRSQYDVFGPNAGMGLAGYEVDAAEHLAVKTRYLSSNDYLIYVKDTIESGKDFLSEEIYNPLAAFSIPRKARASVGYHAGLVPGTQVDTLSASNILKPSDLSLKRTINKNFYNTVIYRFEEDALLDDKFYSGNVVIDGTSTAQIPVGNRALTILSKGLRDSLSGFSQTLIAARRRLSKYKFGAELISKAQTNFATGFGIEVGDVLYVDIASLKLSDINTATRDGVVRLFQVVNKTLNFTSGVISFDLIDTNYNLNSRYALVAPSSLVSSGASNTVFTVTASYSQTLYGSDEGGKWRNYIGAEIVVRSSDYVTSGRANIVSVVGNVITVDASLGFTPLVNYIVEFGDYDNLTDDVKNRYASMSNGNNDFADGIKPYKMS
jgi:hypothetical protein